MRSPRGVYESVRAQIGHLAADISYAQRRFAEVNRPWVARRGDDPQQLDLISGNLGKSQGSVGNRGIASPDRGTRDRPQDRPPGRQCVFPFQGRLLISKVNPSFQLRGTA
jgi:hypothetical protein